MEAGIDFVGMEEAENPRMAHSESLEVRSETAVVQFETELVVHSGKEAVRSGIVEDHCGTEEDRSGTEEAVHSEIEVENWARLAGGIVEVAQTLDSEVDQSSAVAGGMETAVADRAVAAERKVEGKQNRTSFEVGLRMAFAAAAAAEEDSLSRQPCRNLLVYIE